MPSRAIALVRSAAAQGQHPDGMSAGMTMLFAIACGLIVANVYYSQPVAGWIAASLGFSSSTTGLIVACTQAGFGVGLLLIVPLGDLIENRRLVLILLGITTVALLSAAASTEPLVYLVSALLIGLGSVAVQVLVPYAAHMAPESIRGRVVGNVMSGLMIGIMLARPTSSFLAQVASWHAVFCLSAASMFALALAVGLALPRRKPAVAISYAGLLYSMGRLALGTPILQRRALYQAGLFGAFSLFWTTLPLLLTGPDFRMSQGELALFTLAGGAGVVAAPLAGRAADKGWTQPATAFAIVSTAIAVLVTRFAVAGSALGVPLLIAAAILLDFGMTANLTLGQRAIFVLGAEYRNRLNGLYMSTFFAGGALGSTLGGLAYAYGGWSLASWIGFALPIAAFVFFLTERRNGRTMAMSRRRVDRQGAA
jgi:predicted MFS family arabinose efflux permease